MAVEIPLSLKIDALVGVTEQLLVKEAVRLMSEELAAAGGAEVPLELTFWPAIRSDFLVPNGPPIPSEVCDRGLTPGGIRDYCGDFYRRPGPRIVVFSLLADVVQLALRHRQEQWRFLPLDEWQRRWTPAQREWVSSQFVEEPAVDLGATASHWRLILAEMRKTSSAGVFLCNVFRHVPGDLAHRYFGTPPSLGERIRRFNLLGAEVSKDTGAYIVDLDWALANVGASELQTDYRLQGKAAAVAGAAALVSTLFKAGLDEFLPAEVQVKALAHFEARQEAALDGIAMRTGGPQSRPS